MPSRTKSFPARYGSLQWRSALIRTRFKRRKPDIGGEGGGGGRVSQLTLSVRRVAVRPPVLLWGVECFNLAKPVVVRVLH